MDGFYEWRDIEDGFRRDMEWRPGIGAYRTCVDKSGRLRKIVIVRTTTYELMVRWMANRKFPRRTAAAKNNAWIEADGAPAVVFSQKKR